MLHPLYASLSLSLPPSYLSLARSPSFLSLSLACSSSFLSRSLSLPPISSLACSLSLLSPLLSLSPLSISPPLSLSLLSLLLSFLSLPPISLLSLISLSLLSLSLAHSPSYLSHSLTLSLLSLSCSLALSLLSLSLLSLSLSSLLSLSPSYLSRSLTDSLLSLPLTHFLPPISLMLGHSLAFSPSSLSLNPISLSPISFSCPLSLTHTHTHRPKSDTCKTCDSLKTKFDAERDAAALLTLRSEWDLHLCRAEKAYHSLKKDSALARSDADVEVISFDLEKALATPVLSTNVVYYKRQLWTYNLGIHSATTSVGYMYVWHEGQASRGSHEVGSCILKHFNITNPTSTRLVAYSDSCSGQNRNVYILALWLYIVSSDKYSFTTIDHKFMVVGHSYLPNDRDFGSIESSRLKAQHIYVPSDWADLIRKARRKNPFQVIEMSSDDFVSFIKLAKSFVNRKKDTVGRPVDWLSIRWIRVTKDKPLQYSFRNSLNELEAWKVVKLAKRQKGRPVNIGLVVPDRLYSGPRMISDKKLKDLQDLLCYVPPVHHPFFQMLSSHEEESSSESESSSDSDSEED